MNPISVMVYSSILRQVQSHFKFFQISSFNSLFLLKVFTASLDSTLSYWNLGIKITLINLTDFFKFIFKRMDNRFLVLKRPMGMKK